MDIVRNGGVKMKYEKVAPGTAFCCDGEYWLRLANPRSYTTESANLTTGLRKVFDSWQMVECLNCKVVVE